jgi:3-isopropylmalate/(R)-2-methylmalate dehydratase large subunit
MEFDVTDLPPLMSVPPNPDNVHPVAEFSGRRVDSVFLGSCTNGRYEDFALVAEFLAGQKVEPKVMVKAVPATREIYGRLLEDGIIDQLHEAGVIVSHAGCGGCASGQIGMTGKGEVQVSTGNRNFPGKQGDGETYLASPITAIAAAIAGEIIPPVELI